ncbi:MAG: HPr family phosphocarrier protein [Alphaproteobacteria bacterium]|nr:HPr family phosphocarrier protein [Alphaproteobacteria bacterium]
MAQTADTAARSRRTLTIRNRKGLHARASAKFVDCAGRFAATITVSRDDMTVPATSIMGLLMLAAGPGAEILVEARGREADAALDALEALVANGFGETG